MKKLIYLFCLSTLLFSCEKDNSIEQNEEQVILENSSSQNLILDQMKTNNTCFIFGATSVSRGSTITYTTNANLPEIVWGANTPEIKFQGSTTNTNQVTVFFTDSFVGGTITLETTDSNNPGNNCDSTLDITNIIGIEESECPDSSCFSLVNTYDCGDAQIYLNCGTSDVASISFKYAINNARSSVSIGSISYPAGAPSRIVQSFSYPTTNFVNGATLYVFADIILKDGTTCRLSARETFSCAGDGNPI